MILDTQSPNFACFVWCSLDLLRKAICQGNWCEQAREVDAFTKSYQGRNQIEI